MLNAEILCLQGSKKPVGRGKNGGMPGSGTRAVGGKTTKRGGIRAGKGGKGARGGGKRAGNGYETGRDGEKTRSRRPCGPCTVGTGRLFPPGGTIVPPRRYDCSTGTVHGPHGTRAHAAPRRKPGVPPSAPPPSPPERPRRSRPARKRRGLLGFSGESEGQTLPICVARREASKRPYYA